MSAAAEAAIQAPVVLSEFVVLLRKDPVVREAPEPEGCCTRWGPPGGLGWRGAAGLLGCCAVLGDMQDGSRCFSFSPDLPADWVRADAAVMPMKAWRLILARSSTKST